MGRNCGWLTSPKSRKRDLETSLASAKATLRDEAGEHLPVSAGHVHVQGLVVAEVLGAGCTAVGLLPSVFAMVGLEVGYSVCHVRALGARVALANALVRLHVRLQELGVAGSIGAKRARKVA